MSPHEKIVAGLLKLRPGAQWSMTGDDLAKLIWLDESQSRPDDAEIMDAIANGALPTPQSVSMLNARRALRAAGLLDQVTAAIAKQPADVQDAWSLSTTIDRQSPTVKMLALALGLSDAQVDALFVSAAALPQI
jgi:hypothetical protein